MSDTMTAYLEAKKEMQRLVREQTALARKAFGEASGELFAKFPDMESFGWSQYTPYFCDGDPCVFSANTDEPCVNDEWSWEVGEKPAHAAVAAFLGQFTEDDLREMFGDHVKVTVTRDGKASADDYEHD